VGGDHGIMPVIFIKDLNRLSVKFNLAIERLMFVHFLLLCPGLA
jgi:hypothetical protein